jgi:hypothetical protein
MRQVITLDKRYGSQVRVSAISRHYSIPQKHAYTFLGDLNAIGIQIREPDSLTVNASVITPSPVKCMSLQFQV